MSHGALVRQGGAVSHRCFRGGGDGRGRRGKRLGGSELQPLLQHVLAGLLAVRNGAELVDLAAMGREVPRAGKLAPADCAREGLLARVDAHVVLQLPGAGEALLTLAAFVGFDARVGAHVAVESALLPIPHATQLAAEGALVLVHQCVLLQLCLSDEGLGAQLTLPRLVAIVALHVVIVARLRDGLSTQLTVDLVLVGEGVALEEVAGWEGIATCGTQPRLPLLIMTDLLVLGVL